MGLQDKITNFFGHPDSPENAKLNIAEDRDRKNYRKCSPGHKKTLDRIIEQAKTRARWIHAHSQNHFD